MCMGQEVSKLAGTCGASLGQPCFETQEPGILAQARCSRWSHTCRETNVRSLKLHTILKKEHFLLICHIDRMMLRDALSQRHDAPRYYMMLHHDSFELTRDFLLNTGSLHSLLQHS